MEKSYGVTAAAALRRRRPSEGPLRNNLTICCAVTDIPSKQTTPVTAALCLDQRSSVWRRSHAKGWGKFALNIIFYSCWNNVPYISYVIFPGGHAGQLATGTQTHFHTWGQSRADVTHHIKTTECMNKP